MAADIMYLENLGVVTVRTQGKVFRGSWATWKANQPAELVSVLEQNPYVWVRCG